MFKQLQRLDCRRYVKHLMIQLKALPVSQNPLQTCFSAFTLRALELYCLVWRIIAGACSKYLYGSLGRAGAGVNQYLMSYIRHIT